MHADTGHYDLDSLGFDAQLRASFDLVLAKARRRIQSADGQVTGEIRVRSADAPGLWRFCADRGWGKPNSTTKYVTIGMGDLDAWLKRQAGERGIIETLETAGPLVFRRRNTERDEATDTATLAAVAAILHQHHQQTWCVEWLGYLQVAGVKHLLHKETRSVLDAAKILALLPAAGVVRTTLVEKATGNTKALAQRAVDRLALRGLSYRFGAAMPETSGAERELWARAGVIVDSLSSRVLVRGLRMAPTSPVAEWVNSAVALGEPFVLTLDQILRHRLEPRIERLYVCENPAVMESAARQLSPEAAPLLCTEGQPSIAVATLLSSTDAPICWRGDFDWTGIRTTAAALKKYDATPWRMDGETYRYGLELGDSEPLKQKDRQADSPWDPGLAAAMAESGRAVMEERLIDLLFDDLI